MCLCLAGKIAEWNKKNAHTKTNLFEHKKKKTKNNSDKAFKQKLEHILNLDQSRDVERLISILI